MAGGLRRVLPLGSMLVACLAGPLTQVARARAHHHHRPGCGTYCQQAGGLGAGPGPPPPTPAKILDSRLKVSNGAVTVRVRCLLHKTCNGALVLWFHDQPFGRMGGVDLLIPGLGTSRVLVPLNSDATAALMSKRQLKGDAIVFQKGACQKNGSCDTTGTANRTVTVSAS